MITDPVCGMQFDEQQTSFVFVYENATYYFCSEGCRAEFQRHAEEYVKDTPAQQAGETDV